MQAGVSVVFPVHATAEYIDTALTSILAQELAEAWELLVVLDRPDSSCLNAISRYTDSRVRTVESASPGVAHAHNTGVLQAHYDLVAIMHSDDVMMPNRLALQARYLRNNPDVAVVGGQIQLIAEDGSPVGLARYPLSPRQVQSSMNLYCAVAHPSVMYRRSAVIAVGGYRQEYAPAEDLDLWLRILEHYKIANIDNILVQYRRHSSQLSQSNKIQQAESMYRALAAKTLRIRHGSDDLIKSWPHSWTEMFVYRQNVHFEMAMDRLASLRLSREYRSVGMMLLKAFLFNPRRTALRGAGFVGRSWSSGRNRAANSEDRNSDRTIPFE